MRIILRVLRYEDFSEVSKSFQPLKLSRLTITVILLKVNYKPIIVLWACIQETRSGLGGRFEGLLNNCFAKHIVCIINI